MRACGGLFKAPACTVWMGCKLQVTLRVAGHSLQVGGEGIALDHVLPRAVVPELAARFYNLEAIPAKENGSKGAKIGKRELDLARRWQRERLLSTAVEAAAK